MKFVPKWRSGGQSPYCDMHGTDVRGCSECGDSAIKNVRHMLVHADDSPASPSVENGEGWWVFLCADCKREYDPVVGLVEIVGA